MLVRDKKGIVKEKTNAHITIDEVKLNLNGKQTYTDPLKVGDQVIFGYDDQTLNLMFLKSGGAAPSIPTSGSDASILQQINWNLGAMLLLKETELGLRTQEEYKELSKRFK